MHRLEVPVKSITDGGRGLGEYIAHPAPDNGQTQSVRDHLKTVSQLAEKFGEPLGYADEAKLAGLLHDCGKYGDRFQERLVGRTSHIDHWSLGAYWALKHQASAAALAVHGHHVGLQELSIPFFRSIQNFVEGELPTGGLQLSGGTLEIKRRFENDGFRLWNPKNPVITRLPELDEGIETMLAVRFLYSCLVDADYLDTEAHFHQNSQGKQFRPQAPDLRPRQAFQILQTQVDLLQLASSKMSRIVSEMRSRVWKDALAAADRPDGLRTFTAPTGSGKTLSMLGFALRHAERWGKRRIIVALPYLNIIEQTVSVYRDLFECMGDGYVIEHHSMAEREADDDEGMQRLVADNWDAPIVVTTTVQLFESLFTNRPGRARKLHRLTDSVIILDEIQTLPLTVVVPTVASLAALASRFHATVVLGTATQPAFDHLTSSLEQITQAPYQPVEVVSSPLTLTPRVTWQFRSQPQGWAELAEELATHESFLTIVNLKRHAVELFTALTACGIEPFHLSTNMCPLHRADVIREIRYRLEPRNPREATRVVATQCVEAGVDLDFPVVYRAWGPLDSLAQAAGRCNRAGLLSGTGEMVVFQPEEDRYPPGVYRQATDIAKQLWSAAMLNMDDPGTFRQYWDRLYSTVRPEAAEIRNRIQVNDFAGTADRYHLIDGPSMQVLVPYSAEMELYRSLVVEARRAGISRDWVRRAQPLSVGMFPLRKESLGSFVEPVSGFRGEVTNWWICRETEHYHPAFGLDVPEQLDLLLP